MPTTSLTLPPAPAQADRLVALGLHERAGLTAAELRSAAGAAASAVTDDALLVLDPALVPPSALVPGVRWRDRPAFVVVDMTDLDDFAPVPGAEPPPGPAYLLCGPDRGDEYLNVTPDEALPRIRAGGRSPLTLAEGLTWLLQCPDVLERSACTMTVGSRLRRANGSLDARTPALWISNGTGRDGRERRNAPKVGWCWAGNRHTWLGIASASGRVPVT
ncbi:DUF5701 family protein [Geodermatophilus sp. FMUSA9-8]|uniref:DUF5701 family protein n=1 Tax=Geodermatophilus sp. FMUSA9-8 TaxID=3120155 RepID=UPI00300BC309